MEIAFRRGERIHTKSSYKYDWGGVAELLRHSGFQLEHTFEDPTGSFWVHWARAVWTHLYFALCFRWWNGSAPLA